MSLPKNITMTRGGGHFWSAMVFRHLFTYTLLLPIFFTLVIAIINPFWFRDSLFRWIEDRVYKITQWRNYRTYAIYLGTDPKVWHTLKSNPDDF